MKNGIPLGTSKILVMETWAFIYIYGCGEKKSPYSLMCLPFLFEKMMMMILKGNEIYYTLSLRLHIVYKAVVQPLIPFKMTSCFGDINTFPS